MAKKVAIEIDIQGTKDVIELQKQIRATKKELKETEDAEAFSKLNAELVALQSRLQDARKAQRQAVDAFKATDEGVGAYSRLSARARVVRNELKDLSAAGETTGQKFDDLTKELDQLDTTLKEIDRSVGQTNREVGAYEEAVRKAVGITDAQTGAFTRLKGRADVLRRSYRDVATESGKNSKEARQLAKELAKVERQLKQVSGQAQKTGKRIGGLRTQFAGLGPGFASLTSGFLAFSAIPDAIASFSELTEGVQMFIEFVNPAAAAARRFAETQSELTDTFAEEALEINSLFAAGSAENQNKEESLAARKQILDQYGPLLNAQQQEAVLLGDVAEAQKIATDALIANLAAQAAREALAEDVKRIAQAELQLLKVQQSAEESSGALSGFFGAAVTDVANASVEASKVSIEGNAQLEERLKETLQGVSESLKGLTTANRRAGETATREFNKGVESEQAKANERLRKQQEQARARFLKDESRQAERRTQLILKISEEIINAELDAQAEGQAKALAQEEKAQNDRIKALEQQQQKFIQQLEAQQTKVNELFGEESQQAISFAQTAATQREKINTQTNRAIELETAASLKRREDIQKQFADKELQERLKELQAQKQAIVNATNTELLAIREARARGRITEAEAEKQSVEARIQSFKDQLAQLNREEFALIGEQGFGAEVAQEEFDKIATARQKLNTELAELEEEQTAKVEAESQKREGERLKGFTKAFNTIKETLSLVDGFASALGERENARLEGLANERQENIAGLQEELSQASGIEKAFLQQRIQEETKAAEEIAAAQERARKEQAIAQKAIAIGQAIINGALAVTAVLAQTTDPTPVQAFRFAAVAAAIAVTAAQVATIAAQPIAAQGGIEGETFARGGMVHGRSHAQGGEKFRVGGRVVELEGGEAVINKRSTGMFRNQLSAMNVAGGGKSFQVGGVISPPMNAPTLAGSERESSNVLALIKTNTELIQATRELIPKIEVVYTTNTEDSIERDKVDRKEITTRATL